MVLGSSLSFSSFIRLRRQNRCESSYDLNYTWVWLREECTFWVSRTISLCLLLSWGMDTEALYVLMYQICVWQYKRYYFVCVLPECSNVVAGGPAYHKAPLWARAPLIDLVHVACRPHLAHTHLSLPLKVVGWSGNMETKVRVSLHRPKKKINLLQLN